MARRAFRATSTTCATARALASTKGSPLRRRHADPKVEAATSPRRATAWAIVRRTPWPLWAHRDLHRATRTSATGSVLLVRRHARATWCANPARSATTVPAWHRVRSARHAAPTKNAAAGSAWTVSAAQVPAQPHALRAYRQRRGPPRGPVRPSWPARILTWSARLAPVTDRVSASHRRGRLVLAVVPARAATA